MEFEVSAELVSIYLEDAREQLAVLDAVLLRVEREGATPELLASVLGPLHTLKGNSGMIGLARGQGLRPPPRGGVRARPRRRPGARRARRSTGCSRRPRRCAARSRRPAAPAASSGASDATQAALAALAARSAAPAGRLAPAAAGGAAAEPLAGPAKAGDDARPDAPGVVRSSMVRVDFAKLDHLLNLVGELIVYRTKLDELARQVAEALPGVGPELLEAVHQVASASTQLQETIMDVRMLPIRHVFERFPRLVRDLARQQGKEIELVLQGEDTRVDKAVIDELGEPLVHLIRNAVDHGIEAPARPQGARQVADRARCCSRPPRSRTRS